MNTNIRMATPADRKPLNARLFAFLSVPFTLLLAILAIVLGVGVHVSVSWAPPKRRAE